jgi:hypothetical protein
MTDKVGDFSHPKILIVVDELLCEEDVIHSRE